MNDDFKYSKLFQYIDTFKNDFFDTFSRTEFKSERFKEVCEDFFTEIVSYIVEEELFDLKIDVDEYNDDLKLRLVIYNVHEGNKILYKLQVVYHVPYVQYNKTTCKFTVTVSFENDIPRIVKSEMTEYANQTDVTDEMMYLLSDESDMSYEEYISDKE